MKTAILLILFILTYSAGAQGFVFEFEKSYGIDSMNYAVSCLETKSGGYLILGNVITNEDEHNVLLFEVDPKGEILWVKHYNNFIWEYAYDIIRDDNDYLIIGKFSKDSLFFGDYDCFVFKIDSVGNVLWLNTFGHEGDDAVSSFLKINNGNYIVTGESELYKDDAWVVNLDTSGNVIWEHSYGGSGKDEFISFIESDIYFYFLGNSTSGQNDTLDGDVKNNHGAQDVWMIKTNNKGDILWSRCYGGSEVERSYSLLKLNSNFFVTLISNSQDGDVPSDSSSQKLVSFIVDKNGDLIQINQLPFNGSSHSFDAVKTSNNLFLYYFGNNEDKPRLINVDENFNVLWEDRFDEYAGIRKIITTNDNGFATIKNVYFPFNIALDKYKIDISSINEISSASLLSYPNPFDEATEIKFSLDEAAKVDISIYNYVGSLIFSSSEFFGAGDNSFKWNADSLPSGAYLCRISYNDNLQYSYILKK